MVSQKALESMHESRSTGGSFKDRHPWRVAQDLLKEAERDSQRVPILFAVEESQRLTDWALLVDIDVATYSGQRYETLCQFSELQPMNPIFEELSSIVLRPSKEQLHREDIEPIRHYREHLDVRSIHPYAICETPLFILNQSDSDSEDSER